MQFNRLVLLSIVTIVLFPGIHASNGKPSVQSQSESALLIMVDQPAQSVMFSLLALA